MADTPERNASPRGSAPPTPTTSGPAGGHDLQRLHGVGPKMVERLAKLGIGSVGDLLFHLPLRYEDRTLARALHALRPGEHALVSGTVDHSEVNRRPGRRAMLLVHLSDGTGRLTLRFFHFTAQQQLGFARGATVSCFGEARRGTRGLEMIHPECTPTADATPAESADFLTPIYPTTEGLHQLTLRRLVTQALADLAQGHGPSDWLPADLLRDTDLPDLATALLQVHRPPASSDLNLLEGRRHPAQRRLAIEELVAHRLALRRLRAQIQDAPAARIQGRALAAKLLARLPFRLTRAQERVIEEIRADLASPLPMLRLVQGDVGSGKTLVAAAACLDAIEAGFQVALMAPTELLAEQHYRNLGAWLTPLGIDVAWFAGSLKGRARSRMLERLASGRAALAVGTHALFQDAVRFRRLALVIIDEQHRFGVHQRLALKDKGTPSGLVPHQLVMTATPIPRTLAMTAYADLETSIIDQLPPGRRPVRTVVIPDGRREEVVAGVRRACAEGRQVYWVCTLIEESEALQCEAAENTASTLREVLPESTRIGLIHGRMKATDKDTVMQAFGRGALDLLVATTVIEVGVDVPNASLMIIENAERLGLSQLHQLRGRVGRGSTESTCVLFYKSPLSRQAKTRLRVMRETTDGFIIAQRDLELRGPGEVLGTRQTGLSQLRVADLGRDQDLLGEVARIADAILRDHPERIEPLIERWLGEAHRYAGV